MAVITSYTTLQAAVQDYLARSDLSGWVPNFVQNFEERFFRQPRNYGSWMEASLSISFSSTAAVPADYLSARIFYLNGQTTQPLKVSSLEQLYLAYPRANSAGVPRWISRDGANFVFGPVPSGTFTLNGTYYAKPTLIRNAASDAANHYLILNAPDLLLYGALREAEAFVNDDERIELWGNAYLKAEQDYRDLMRAQNFSGGAMQVLIA